MLQSAYTNQFYLLEENDTINGFEGFPMQNELQIQNQQLTSILGQSIVAGFNENVHNIIALNYVDNQLQMLQKFLISAHPKEKPIDHIPYEFLTSRGMLSRLFLSFIPGDKFDPGFKFYSISYKDKILLKEAKTDMKLKSQVGQHLNLQKSIYGGLKFESLMAPEKHSTIYGIFGGYLFNPDDQNESGKRILYTAEIDAIWQEAFVELKSKSSATFYAPQKMKQDYFKWYIQTKLACTQNLLVGLHQDFVLQEVKEMKREELEQNLDTDLVKNAYKMMKQQLDFVSKIHGQFPGNLICWERTKDSVFFESNVPEDTIQLQKIFLLDEFKDHWKNPESWKSK